MFEDKINFAKFEIRNKHYNLFLKNAIKNVNIFKNLLILTILIMILIQLSFKIIDNYCKRYKR